MDSHSGVPFQPRNVPGEPLAGAHIWLVRVYQPFGTYTPSSEHRVVALVGTDFNHPHPRMEESSHRREGFRLVCGSEERIPADEVLGRAFPPHGACGPVGSERVLHLLHKAIPAHEIRRRQPALNAIRPPESAERAHASSQRQSRAVGGSDR